MEQNRSVANAEIITLKKPVKKKPSNRRVNPMEKHSQQYVEYDFFVRRDHPVRSDEISALYHIKPNALVGTKILLSSVSSSKEAYIYECGEINCGCIVLYLQEAHNDTTSRIFIDDCDLHLNNPPFSNSTITILSERDET